MRGGDAAELMRKNPNAYCLAAVIARRARWNAGYDADDVELGEAFLGDHKAYGMTRQQYRTAEAHLKKGNFATFRSTNKGTIAKLTDTRLFDPLNNTDNQPNHQTPTGGQPPDNQPATTNEEGKKEKIKEGKSEFIKETFAIKDLQPRLTQLMVDARQILGDLEMERYHSRWLGRAETAADKLRRVLAETKRAANADEIITTRAQFAEDLWKRWPA